MQIDTSHYEFAVDWISATFPAASGLHFAKRLGYKGWATDNKAIPQRGYDNAVELIEHGARINWSSKRDDMGVHIALNGNALSWFRSKSVDGLQMLKWIKQDHGRVSRIDLAIDMYNTGLQQAEFSKDTLKAYHGKGRTPRITRVLNDDRSYTVYVGARTSDKFMRIYDKAKERGDFSRDIIRVEIECKGMVAHAIGHEFPTMSYEGCLAMAKTLMRNQADFKMKAWNDMLKSEHVVLALPTTKERKTLEWLLVSAAPALAKEMQRSNDPQALLDTFLTQVEQTYAQLRAEISPLLD